MSYSNNVRSLPGHTTQFGKDLEQRIVISGKYHNLGDRN